MKLIKKDFIPSGVKSVCGRDLPSGKAYYIDDNNIVVYGSDDYVSKNFLSEERSTVMDFTAGLIASFDKKTSREPSREKSESQSYRNSNKYKAILYLYLHEEKMDKFNLPKWSSFLTNVYKHYKEKEFLTDKQVEKVLEIEKSQNNFINKKNYKTKTLKNLISCYAYEYKVKRALEVLEENKKEYMSSMLTSLYKNLYLTDDQIEGMFKWFEKLPKDLAETKLKEFDKTGL